MSSSISIHAPREGGDAGPRQGFPRPCDFNPRPPRGGRLQQILDRFVLLPISIHAPREGGDACKSDMIDYDKHISIHAPREGGDEAC